MIMPYLARMDIFEVRRQAVLKLIAGPRFQGNQAAFARDTGISQSYVSRMLKPIGDANGKRIADTMAFKIEDSLGLLSGTIHSPASPQFDDDRRAAFERAREESKDNIRHLGEAVELLAGALSAASPLSRKGAAPILASLAEKPASWMQVASLLNAMLKPVVAGAAPGLSSRGKAPTKSASNRGTGTSRGQKAR